MVDVKHVRIFRYSQWLILIFALSFEYDNAGPFCIRLGFGYDFVFHSYVKPASALLFSMVAIEPWIDVDVSQN